MTIKFHISDYLGKKKMTQAELSRRTGIRPATISGFYHDTVKRIEVDQLDRLCNTLDCQPGDLLSHIKEDGSEI